MKQEAKENNYSGSNFNSSQPIGDRKVLGENSKIENKQKAKVTEDPDNPLNKSIQLDENNIEEYIQILEEHQKNCEKTGKYVEAEMAKNRVKELRAQDQVRRKKQMKSKQLNEKLQIEQAYLNEFNQFNEFWDQKMQEFNEQATQIEDQMIQRHQMESQKYLEELEKSIPVKPKDSAELLNLRKIQESLARQQNYIEAHQVQQQSLQLEKNEYEKWKKERDLKIKNQIGLLEQKQGYELEALRQKIESGQEEQRKARSQELERLLQKYQNVKKGLENQHSSEMYKHEKACKYTNSYYRSSVVNSSMRLNDSARVSNTSKH